MISLCLSAFVPSARLNTAGTATATGRTRNAEAEAEAEAVNGFNNLNERCMASGRYQLVGCERIRPGATGAGSVTSGESTSRDKHMKSGGGGRGAVADGSP